MDLRTGATRPDSLFAAANTVEIVDAFIAAGAPLPRARLIADFDGMFVDASAHAVPIADTPALLADLRARGIAIGIASSDNEASIRATARTLGIDGLVDFVAGYDSGHGVKPGPGMFAAFCRAIGAPAASVAMVGDNRHDMEMARSAGAGLVVAVLSGTGTSETLAAISDVCLPSIADLPAFLDAPARRDAIARRSAPLPDRIALLGEGPEAFHVVFGGIERVDGAEFPLRDPVHGLLEAHRLRLADDFLDRREHERRAAGEHCRDLPDARLQVAAPAAPR